MCYDFFIVLHASKEKQTGTQNVRYGDRIHYGRITETLVQGEIGDTTDTDTILVLISGTKSFDKDMVNFVKRAGLSEEQYHKF